MQPTLPPAAKAATRTLDAAAASVVPRTSTPASRRRTWMQPWREYTIVAQADAAPPHAASSVGAPASCERPRLRPWCRRAIQADAPPPLVAPGVGGRVLDAAHERWRTQPLHVLPLVRARLSHTGEHDPGAAHSAGECAQRGHDTSTRAWHPGAVERVQRARTNTTSQRRWSMKLQPVHPPAAVVS
jgi:hypothetical protein